MTYPIYSSHGQISIPSLLNPDNPQVSLDTIRWAFGKINEIRKLLAGDKNLCLNLFKQAVEENDAVSQIQLAYAYFGMVQENDQNKSKAHLDLLPSFEPELFFYYPKEFELFYSIYHEAMNAHIDQQRAIDTYSAAASHGYLPAFVELKHAEWRPYSLNCFGLAVQLRPFVGKGNKELDSLFGNALLHGCGWGTDLYHAGAYFMNTSISSAEKSQSVDLFHPDWFAVSFDSDEIKKLLEEYQVGTMSWGKYPFTTLTLYQHGQELGNITVNIQTKQISTIRNSSIQPVIEFAETVMLRSYSANSAASWLSKIGGKL